MKAESTLQKVHENSKIFDQDFYLTYVNCKLHLKWWKTIVANWFLPIIAAKIVYM